MPDSCRNSKRAAAVEEDRIGALPDGVLQLVLSSLPSDEAVWTCVLSRRWQHLWKSTPALRITRGGARDWRPWVLNNFVNHLLLLRGGSPADECEISCDKFLMDDGAELFRSILTRVELKEVTLMMRTLDFSSCPVLENLSMSCCDICGNRILSQSVRSLSITRCHFEGTIRTRISAPCLISLQLDDISGRAPLLERMPLLVAAQVKLDYSCSDVCRHNGYGDCHSENCIGNFNNHDGSNCCVLLEGLSGATILELPSGYHVFILRKNYKFCPTFIKLKTLVLNEWCVAADFGPLVFFLQNSPILEKLTLELEHHETKQPVVETGDSYNAAEQSLVSKQLKVVEIKCRKENKLVEQISIILRIHGVPPEQIEIQENLLPSDISSFELDSDSDW